MLESCVSRFSAICAKNLVLKIKIDKVTVIRVYLIPPFWRTSPVAHTAVGHMRIPEIEKCCARSYDTRSPLKNIRARGRIIFLFFTRRARAENKANQQCHFKSSRCRMDPLGTDSCRGTVPMEPLMSNNSMRHQNPGGDFDDTGQILWGASCTIAAFPC
jgi:hypothetical protein